MGQLTQGTLAQKIDHTLLKPEASREQIRQLCVEAIQMDFFSVCINPVHVGFARECLAGSTVKVCTVIGFPLGANHPLGKRSEAEIALQEGADELDMVINIGALKEQEDAFVEDDIRGVVQAAAGKTVKVILETSLLTDDEKIRACKLAKEAGAHFVKTSTGFSTGGATVEDIRLMRKAVGHAMGIKASGGIRDYATLVAMIEAGANRIGTSSGVSLLQNGKAKDGY